MKNEQLLGKNELLSDEMTSLESKLTKYKVTCFKSIKQLGDILKDLLMTKTQDEKEF